MYVGIDVGSTTVKIAVVDPSTRELLHSDYQRHNADQAGTVHKMLAEAHKLYPEETFELAVCGSGGQTIADILGAFFIQEVVANSIIIREFYQDVRVAIELGGQDAKVIFFRYDKETGQLVTSDMRMNGSCAGGTGAFIDQVAELLNVEPNEFGAMAERGKIVYDISGRCGVFAKTDIQPLLNQGVAKEDIALSTFHAIAKQTIGGLAQGMDITPKVIFEGGPLTFNPRLITVFKERLNLSDEHVVIPRKAEIMVAWGAALSVDAMFGEKECSYKPESALPRLLSKEARNNGAEDSLVEPFFASPEEREHFIAAHVLPVFQPKQFDPGTEVRAYLGIDAGSTTSKFVLLDEQGDIIYKYYSSNHGDPLKVVKHAILQMENEFHERTLKLKILGVGSTGYGENLFARAFKTDYHTVETVAHAEAAQMYAEDVSFILDIGGQDMKAIYIRDGVVSDIVLNEACSAGCGSFIETYARSLGVPVDRISSLAFESDLPSMLGSRCTVFMNSSIITEQKNGKTTADILAGICKSIVENVFTKVVRISNFDALGSTIVVQGGTFKNDAVLRSLEQYTGRTVVRPPYPGEMGAIGIALLTKKYVERQTEKNGSYESTFIGLENMWQFNYEKKPGQICHFCMNNCNRTIVNFNDGSTYVTGNRCEKGEVIGDVNDEAVKKQLKSINKKLTSVPDTLKLHSKLLTKNYPALVIAPRKNLRIGIPRILEYWVSLPFWKSFFTSLGYDVVVSRKSDYRLFERGLQSVPSDTVCFPAKIAHGHVLDLIEQKVDRIFMPMMIRIPPENKHSKGDCLCPVVQGYPMIIDKSDEPERRFNIPLDHPVFHWYTAKLKHSQITDYMVKHYGVKKGEVKVALQIAESNAQLFRWEMLGAGSKILRSLKGSDFAVVLAGRPYHSDELVNHDLSSHFTNLGIPVISLDSLPGLDKEDVSTSRMESYVPFHVRMIAAAMAVAKHPNLELVQIVSFGCGHDAIISDEMKRVLSETSGKELLILKLDEGDVKGPLNIRIKSFVETIRKKRAANLKNDFFRPLKDGFPVKFLKQNKKDKTIFVPNLSVAFAVLTSRILEGQGFRVLPLPVADKKAIALGKKYVHNDICFPAQINIGEILNLLESGKFDPNSVAVGFAKNCDACRAGQYSSLARKALDEAGYSQVPIITTGEDTKNIHPGFKIGLSFQINMLWGMTMVDGLETMRRAIRPYEINKGETDAVFDMCLDSVVEAVVSNKRKALREFEKAVKRFNTIPVNRTVRKPRVCLVGEILMKYHPGANAYIERYLENNGMEMVVPGMVDFFRRDSYIRKEMGKRNLHPNPWMTILTADIEDKLYGYVNKKVAKRLEEFRFLDPQHDVHTLVHHIEGMIDKSFISGEGWLIPAEIMESINHGVNSFVIVQPFGCLPNHITGRGMIKAIKEKYPHVQILSLDYDPDTSFANLENRLQMLIITAKELEKQGRPVAC